MQHLDPFFSNTRASHPSGADSQAPPGQSAALRDDPIASRPGARWLVERRSAIEYCISNDLI